MKKIIGALFAGCLLVSSSTFADVNDKNNVNILIHVLNNDLKIVTRRDKKLTIRRQTIAPKKEETTLTNMVWDNSLYSNVFSNGAIVDSVHRASVNRYTVVEDSNNGLVSNTDYNIHTLNVPVVSRELVIVPKAKNKLTVNSYLPNPFVSRYGRLQLEVNMKPFNGASYKNMTGLKVLYTAEATRVATNQKTKLTSTSPKVVFKGLRSGIYSFRYQISILNKNNKALTTTKWSSATRAYAVNSLETVTPYDHLYEPAIKTVGVTHWAAYPSKGMSGGNDVFGNVPEAQIYKNGIYNTYSNLTIQYAYQIQQLKEDRKCVNGMCFDSVYEKTNIPSTGSYSSVGQVDEQINFGKSNSVPTSNKIIFCHDTEHTCSEGGCKLYTPYDPRSNLKFTGRCNIVPIKYLEEASYFSYKYRIEFLRNGKVITATKWSDSGIYYLAPVCSDHGTSCFSMYANCGQDLIPFRPLELGANGAYFTQKNGNSRMGNNSLRTTRAIRPGNAFPNYIEVMNRDTNVRKSFTQMCDKNKDPEACKKLPLNKLLTPGRYQVRFKSISDTNTWSPALDFTLKK